MLVQVLDLLPFSFSDSITPAGVWVEKSPQKPPQEWEAIVFTSRNYQGILFLVYNPCETVACFRLFGERTLELGTHFFNWLLPPVSDDHGLEEGERKN